MNFFKSLNNFFGIDGPTLQELQEIEDSRSEYFPRVGHTVNQWKYFKATGKHQKYINAYDMASQVIMRKMINEGRDTIYLDEVCDVLDARTPAERNSVLHGVWDFKEKGFLANTDTRKIYKVLK